MAGTLVIAELAEGKVKKSTFSAVTFAKQVGAPFAIVVIGILALAGRLADDGGQRPHKARAFRRQQFGSRLHRANELAGNRQQASSNTSL